HGGLHRSLIDLSGGLQDCSVTDAIAKRKTAMMQVLANALPAISPNSVSANESIFGMFSQYMP
ncbi:MAG: hypothetical protein ACKPKO_18450, partial [Candidatus Fonsibacter sp.]